MNPVKHTAETTNTCSLSTTWEWRKCMMRAVRTRQGNQSPKASALPFRTPRRWYRPLGIRITYRGGPECSWLVETADQSWRFPGHMCLADVALKMAGL